MMLKTVCFVVALWTPCVCFAQTANTPWTETEASGAVENFALDAPGRFTLSFVSQRPQHVIIERRVVGTPRRDGRMVLASGTCTTPCILHVSPGTLVLRSNGPGLRSTDTSFDAPSFNARLTLRAPSTQPWNIGVALVVGASTLVLAIAGISLATQITGSPQPPIETVLGVGAGAVGFFAVGIPLMVLNRSGVESIRPGF
jgi:hypothetical protein